MIDDHKSKGEWKIQLTMPIIFVSFTDSNETHEIHTKSDNIAIMTHPALRRCDDVAAMSLCTSQRRHRYVSNETPNDVSMERREDVSMVRLHDVLLERHNDVSPLRLHDVSNKSQMKHPTTS